MTQFGDQIFQVQSDDGLVLNDQNLASQLAINGLLGAQDGSFHFLWGLIDNEGGLFQAEGDKVEAETFGDRLHHPLVVGVLELDHLAGVDVYEVKVMAVLRRLVAGAATAEVAAFQDPLFLEQPHRSIDRGDRDARIEGCGAAVKFLHVGMIGDAEVKLFLDSLADVLDDASKGSGLMWDFGRTLIKQAVRA